MPQFLSERIVLLFCSYEAMRIAIASELNRRAIVMNNSNIQQHLPEQQQQHQYQQRQLQQQFIVNRHQQQQQLLHHHQMLQYVQPNVKDDLSAQQQQLSQHQLTQQQQLAQHQLTPHQPDIITSTTPSIVHSVLQLPAKRSFTETPLPLTSQIAPMTSQLTQMTSQVAEEEEEDNFYTAGVIPKSTSIAEKVAQASPVVCVLGHERGEEERDRLRQKALVESVESSV